MATYLPETDFLGVRWCPIWFDGENDREPIQTALWTLLIVLAQRNHQANHMCGAVEVKSSSTGQRW